MLDLQTLLDIRRVLIDFLTAYHSDESFAELLEITSKVNLAIIESKGNLKVSDSPKKESRAREDFKIATALAKASKESCSDNYNLFAMYEDCENMACVYRENNLTGLLLYLEKDRDAFERGFKNFVVLGRNGEKTEFFGYSISELICNLKNYINTHTK